MYDRLSDYSVDGKIEATGTLKGKQAENAGEAVMVDTNKLIPDTFISSNIARTSDMTDGLETKVTKNANIVAGTKTKITYDAKGLVTAGSALVAGDIPSLDAGKITTGTFADSRIPTLAISKITGLQTALDGKVDKNTAITGATKCKITYDAKGLVTAGADLVASDIPVLDTAKITTGTFVDARIPSSVERTANKVSSFGEIPTDTAYPTEKLVKDSLDDIQEQIDDLPSGGGVTVTPVTEWSVTPSDDDVPSEKLVKDTFGDYLPLAGGMMTGVIRTRPNTGGMSILNNYGDNYRGYGFAGHTPIIRNEGNYLFLYELYAQLNNTRPISTRGNNDVVVWGNIVDLMSEENGIATLDNTGKVPSAQLPSSVTPVTEWSETPSDNNTPSEKLVKDSLDSAIQSAIYDAWNEAI